MRTVFKLNDVVDIRDIFELEPVVSDDVLIQNNIKVAEFLIIRDIILCSSLGVNGFDFY
jgi:hypothetical protein